MKLQIMKKMPRVAAMGTAVLMLAGMVPTVAMANNCRDHTWTFNVAGTGGSAYVATYNREKTDKTSSYMKCTSYTKTYYMGQGNAYSATVHGSMEVIGGLADRYYGSQHSETKIFVEGSEEYLKNYVGETNHNYANIYCSDKYTTYATFTGLWSPDSV